MSLGIISFVTSSGGFRSKLQGFRVNRSARLPTKSGSATPSYPQNQDQDQLKLSVHNILLVSHHNLSQARLQTPRLIHQLQHILPLKQGSWVGVIDIGHHLLVSRLYRSQKQTVRTRP